MAVHVSPAFRIELGDTVTVGESAWTLVTICQYADALPGQCRPLSKTVRFNVLRVSKNKATTKSFSKF